LTVLGILLLLLGIVIPMFVEARERSSRFYCQNNLRQIGQALSIYFADNKGQTPMPSQDQFPPGGPGPENVSAAIFHLMKVCELQPRLFVCPNTDAVPDDFEGESIQSRFDFTDCRRNLSYSMQNPYPADSLADGLRRFRAAKPDFVIMADMNPGIIGEDDNVLAITATAPERIVRWGNSNNHSKRGQNVLYADGRVEFVETPFVGVDGDNIYATRNYTVLDYPADEDDNILLPTDD